MIKLQVSQSNPPPGFIDLGIGHPDYSLLPLQLLHRASEKYFATEDLHPLQYGLEQGNGYFRQALASFLTIAYNSTPVDPRLLLVTTGASSAIDLICTLFTHAGDVVFVEEPSYFLALGIFKDHGLRVVPIPLDNDGLCLDILEDRIIEFHPKLIYTIPTFQNPSGLTLSQDRREKLMALAQRYNVFVIADEVYHFLAYIQSPPQSFAIFVEDVEQVISVNSFSKILAPGLRLGWIQAHGKVIKRLANSSLLDSGGGMNPFTSAIVKDLIESGGIEKNIINLRKEYSSRLDAMGGALHQYLPASKWRLPQGGFFFWVHLPSVDATELCLRAKEFEVGLREGALFSSRKGSQDYFRLSFSFYDPIKIAEGVKRLGNCLEFSFNLQQ